MTVSKKGTFEIGSYTVLAQNKDGSNSATVSCSITVDGKVVATDQAKGPYATVHCVASN